MGEQITAQHPHHQEPLARGEDAQRGGESDAPAGRNDDNLSCLLFKAFQAGWFWGFVAFRVFWITWMLPKKEALPH